MGVGDQSNFESLCASARLVLVSWAPGWLCIAQSIRKANSNRQSPSMTEWCRRHRFASLAAL